MKNRLFNKRKKGVYLFLFFLLLGISIISSGVLSDNLTGNSIKNFAEYKGGEQFDKGKGEISTFEKKEIKSTSVEGFENGKEKREDFVSDNFILSSYGTPLELVGKGTTPNEQELLYKFNSTDKPYSYVAIESEGIKKLEFFKKQNTAPKTKNEKTISNEEPLDFSKEAEIKNFTKFWNSSESDKIKNKLENSNINSLNSEVIPKENVSLYKIKHKQKSQVYVRVKTSSDLKFLVLDPAGSSAVFDSGFSAPYCSNYLSPCIANSSLLISRDNIDVNEPNSPNTIDSAPDGTSGSYQSDESVENITITNLNHSSFGGGDTVEVSTWVYCWGDSDDINFGYSPNASSPAWQQAYHTTCAGTGFFQYSTQITTSNQGGNHAFRVLNGYNAGETTYDSGDWTDHDDLVIEFDNSIPEINLNSPLNKSIINQGEEINLSIFDNESGIANVSYSLDGGANQTLSPEYNINTSSWTQGDRHIRVYAIDSAGNKNSEYYEFTIDSEYPFVKILSPESKNYSTDEIWFNYTVSDEYLDSVFYSFNSEPNTSISNNKTITADQGNNNLILYANDSTGKTNSSYVSFNVDTIQPLINLDNPTNNSKIDNGSIMEYTVSDTNLDKVIYNLNGVNKTDFVGTYDLDTSDWEKGINNITIYANDSFGNKNSKYYRFNITIDLPPVLSLDSPKNNSVIKGNTTLNFTVSDSSLDSVWYYLDGERKTDFIGTYDIKLQRSQEGNFWLNYSANDTKGQKATKKYFFEVDNTKPNLTIYNPENITYSEEEIWINYTSFDNNLETTVYSLNSGSNISITSNTTINPPEGSNVLEMYANDSAGNIIYKKVFFSKDVTSPNIYVKTPENHTYYQTDILANLSLSEESSNCYYDIDSSGNQSMNKDSDTLFSKRILGLSENNHNIKFWCNDSAGNWNSTRIYFSVSGQGTKYNSSFGAPYCSNYTSPCIIGKDLIISKNNLSTREPNFPNTIDEASDGNLGIYKNEGSIDEINITDLKESVFSSGHTIEVSVLAYCREGNASKNRVNIITSDNISSLNWTVQDSNVCQSTGFSVFKKNITLPETERFVIRGLIEYEGDENSINQTSGYGDQDDVVISLDNYPPKIILENITNNSEILPGEIINFTFEDKENNFDSAVYSKDSESNQSFSGKINTSEWSPGEHFLRIWVNDTAGNYNSSYYKFTIKDIHNPVVKILNPLEGKEYNQTDPVEIKTNITENVEVDKVLANITWNNSNNNDLIELDYRGENIYSGNFTQTTIIGIYNVSIFANDTSNNINNTQETWFNITPVSTFVYWNDSSLDLGEIEISKGQKSGIRKILSEGSNTNISLKCSSGDCGNVTSNYSYGENLSDSESLSVNFTCSSNKISDLSAEFKITSDEDPFNHSLNVDCSFVDTTPPSCNLVNITPSDITAGSFGNLNVLINCTDFSGINTSRYFMTRTVEDGYSSGLPNEWSMRPPSNNKADTCPFCGADVLRAEGRNLGKWYEYLGLFNDNHSYAVDDKSSFNVNIDSSGNWALYNFTKPIESSVYQSSLFLDREAIESEPKKEFHIYKGHGALMKYYDLGNVKDLKDYKIRAFTNMYYQGSPDQRLDYYYCNSSYNTVSKETSSLEGLRALWHLNEAGGEVIDNINGNNGTVYGAEYNVRSKFNTGLNFNGSNYVNVPNSPSLNIQGENLFISAWVKWDINPREGDSRANILDKNRESQYKLAHSEKNNGFIFNIDTSEGTKSVEGTTAPQKERWYYVAGEYNSTHINLYVNGRLENSVKHNGTLSTSASSLNIGRRTGDERYFNGTIDEVLISSKSYNKSFVESHYRNSIILPGDDRKNCVYVTYTEPEHFQRYYYSRNSSYGSGTFAINNGTMGGVKATNEFYIAYTSETDPSKGNYTIRYVNGSSGTNVGFNETNVSFSILGEGEKINQLDFTPDNWFAALSEGDEISLGIYAEDNKGNNYTNFSFYQDLIEVVNYPSTYPTIREYESDTGKDYYLNNYHSGEFCVLVGVSIDSDGVGSVNHNLTLRNIDGSHNYTINGSFYSPDDSDVLKCFNSTEISDGEHKTNITSVADDNPGDVNSYLTKESFIIDNTPPKIGFNSPTPLNNTLKQNYYIEANVSIEDENTREIDIHLYQGERLLEEKNFDSDSAFYNFTSLQKGEYTLYSEGYDLAGNINSTEIRTITLDKFPNKPSLVSPLNNSFDVSLNPMLNVSVSDPDGGEVNVSFYNSSGLSPQLLGTQTGISSGSYVNMTWFGLKQETTYEWYVNVTDGTLTTSSMVWNFTTGEFTPPQFTAIPTDENITYGTDWTGVQFEATDEHNDLHTWFTNDTSNFNINQTGYLDDNPLLSAGNYSVNVSVNDTKGNINSTVYVLTVEKATPSLSLNADPSWNESYGTETNISGLDCPEQLNCSLYRNGNSISNPDVQTLSAGSYPYEYNTTGNENYTSNSVSNILTINKANAGCHVLFNETSSIIYPDSFKVWYNCSVSASLYRNGTLIVNGSTQNLAAGYYNFSVQTNDSENYTNNYDEEFFIIEKATPNLGIEGSSPITYGIETDVNGTNCPSQLNCTLNQSNKIYGVGNETFKYFTDGNENYTNDEVTTTITIQPKDLNITAENKSKIYGESDPIFSVTYSGFISGEDETNLEGSLSFNREAGQDVGNYSVEPYGYTSNNYSISYYNGTLTINKRDIEITADDKSKTYGETDPTLTHTITSGSLQFNDNITGSLDREDGEAVGTYNINQGILGIEDGNSGNNYNLSFITGTFEITKATPSLSLNADPSWNEDYGTETNISGLDCLEQLNCSLYRNGNSISNPDIQTLSAGSYSYEYNTTGNENYTSDSVSNTLSIGTQPLTGSLSGNNVTYSDNLEISFSESNTGDSDVDYELYRNGNFVQNINNGESVVQDLASGVYEFKVNSTGGTNYSSNNNIDKITLEVYENTGSCSVLFNETSPLTYPDEFKIYTDCDTDFTLRRNDSVISNNSVQNLAAGYYNFSVQRTDTENYTNTYDEEFFTINKTMPSASLTNNRSWSFTYDGNPASIGINKTANIGDSDVIYTLWKDNVNVSSSDLEASVGTYFYKINTTGGENYSSTDNLDNNTLIINKETGSVNLLLNGTDGNISFVYGNQINASASSTGQTIALYRNGTNITSQNNVFKDIAAGYYNYTAVALENENYAKASETHFLTVSKADPGLSLNAEPSWNESYGTETNITGLGCPSQLEHRLIRNESEVSNPDISVLEIGEHKYEFLTLGNENYTYDSVSDTLTINKGSLTGNLNGDNVVYPENLSVNFSENNLGDSDVDYELYRNGNFVQNINNGDTLDQDLNIGDYEFKVNSTGGENYSENANIDKITLYVNEEPNYAPNKPKLIAPKNNSRNLKTSVVLNVSVSDPDGDEMNVSFYDNKTRELIGSLENVSNESYASYIWSNLEQATTYEWYVNVTDGFFTTNSDVWNFSTFNNNLTKCKEINLSGYYILGNNITNGTNGIKENCFNITADNVILDGNGYEIKGDGDPDGYGVYIKNSINITIEDFGKIKGFNNGIYFESSLNNSITNNNLFNNMRGISLNNTNNSVFMNNHINEEKGVEIRENCRNNLFYFNAFFNGSFYFINNSGIGNDFNTTLNGNPAGNYYSDILNHEIYDSNNNGYADYGLDYPYNNSTGRWIGGGEDYGPIVPYFILNSPVNGKSFASGTNSVLLNFSIKDIERKNYNLTVYKNDNTELYNKTNISGGNFVNCSWTGLSNGRTYSWYVNASFRDYNFSSPIWNFNVNSEDDGDDGGGGSSGGSIGGEIISYWISTKEISDEDFSQGFNGERGERQRYMVRVDGEKHYIGVVNINKERERVTINVSSEIQQETFSIGDTRKFDVNGDGYYDIWIRLNGFNPLSGKGLLTIRAIHEEISSESEKEPEEDAVGEQEKNETKEQVPEEEEEKDYSWIWAVAAITVILIVAIISIIKKKQRSAV